MVIIIDERESCSRGFARLTGIEGAPAGLVARRPRPHAAAVVSMGGRAMTAGDAVREIKLDPDPTSVRAARRFVRTSLRELGFPESVDDGVLVVSELVTNAIAAAPELPCTVVVRAEGRHPVIEVHDGSPELPEKREPDFVSTHGRGLHVVEKLCAAWDCVWSDHGKAVIAVLP